MFDVIKEHKAKAILSSLIILLPCLVGLILWNSLPESMLIHWGADGSGDGFSSKAFAVFVMPLIILALHWLCLLFTAADPGNKGRNRKAMGMVFWILPILSLCVSGIIYGAALGKEIGAEFLTPAVIGIMFIVFGNYFPKISRNSTIGIKVPWTMRSDENWNMTHRFGGKVWVIGGFVLLAAMLLPEKLFVIIIVADMLVMAVMPVAYSYLYYRKQLKGGSYAPSGSLLYGQKKTGAVMGTVIAVAVLVLCAVLMFTGDIAIVTEEDGLNISASYYSDLTVPYSKIDSLELRDELDGGYRSNGFGSPRLSMGQFKNDEFGHYVRYTYTAVDSCIVIKGGGEVLVIGGKNDDETQDIYEQLLERIEK